MVGGNTAVGGELDCPIGIILLYLEAFMSVLGVHSQRLWRFKHSSLIEKIGAVPPCTFFVCPGLTPVPDIS